MKNFSKIYKIKSNLLLNHWKVKLTKWQEIRISLLKKMTKVRNIILDGISNKE
jgi:hypothetical protein